MALAPQPLYGNPLKGKSAVLAEATATAGMSLEDTCPPASANLLPAPESPVDVRTPVMVSLAAAGAPVDSGAVRTPPAATPSVPLPKSPANAYRSTRSHCRCVQCDGSVPGGGGGGSGIAADMNKNSTPPLLWDSRAQIHRLLYGRLGQRLHNCHCLRVLW